MEMTYLKDAFVDLSENEIFVVEGEGPKAIVAAVVIVGVMAVSPPATLNPPTPPRPPGSGCTPSPWS